MTNLNKFAAQQLSKKEMNHISGGAGIADCVGKEYNIECTVVDNNGISRRIYACADQNGTAIMNAASIAYKHGAAISNENCVFF